MSVQAKEINLEWGALQRALDRPDVLGAGGPVRPERWLEAFPRDLAEKLAQGHKELAGPTCEVRLRIGQPLTMAGPWRQIYWRRQGWLDYPPAGEPLADAGEVFTDEELERLWLRITGGSQYRLETELRGGYLTLPGGHRLGFCGRAVTEDGRLKTMRDISYLNLRLARQIKGTLTPWLPWLQSGGEWRSCLVIGPPLSGKTTLLRELVRLASTGVDLGQDGIVSGVNVSLVDERSELAGAWQGQAQFDLGPRTDVLDACPKAEGMLLAIRSMGPQILAVDEIGGAGDLAALETALVCGVKVFATAHGGSLEEISRRPGLKALLGQGLFDRLALLGRQGPRGKRDIVILDGRTLAPINGQRREEGGGYA